jgi:hypothetical protein
MAEPAGIVHLHVQLEPAAPLEVLHSELRSHVHEFGVTVSPELLTIPTQEFEQAALPAGQEPPLLSLQKLVSSIVVIVSSRHSEGRTQSVLVPDPGPLIDGIEMLVQASLGGGGGGGGGQPMTPAATTARAMRTWLFMARDYTTV